MQPSVLPIIAILTTVTDSQKYKKIYVTTKDNFKFKNLTPQNRTILFEMRTCADKPAIKLIKQFPHESDAVYKIKPNKKGIITFYKYPNDEEVVARATYPFAVDCGKFYKFRISWTRALNLSVVTPTGWETLLSWQDPALYTGVFKWVYLFGYNTDWKIYHIEHTTSPYRVTCVNFG